MDPRTTRAEDRHAGDPRAVPSRIAKSGRYVPFELSFAVESDAFLRPLRFSRGLSFFSARAGFSPSFRAARRVKVISMTLRSLAGRVPERPAGIHASREVPMAGPSHPRCEPESRRYRPPLQLRLQFRTSAMGHRPAKRETARNSGSSSTTPFLGSFPSKPTYLGQRDVL